jgi:hypothetical protein
MEKLLYGSEAIPPLITEYKDFRLGYYEKRKEYITGRTHFQNDRKSSNKIHWRSL